MPSITRRGLVAVGASAALAGCGLQRDRMTKVRVSNWTDRRVRVALTARRKSTGEVVIDESLPLEPDEGWQSDSLETGDYRVSVEVGDREQAGVFPFSATQSVFVYVRADGIRLVSVVA